MSCWQGQGAELGEAEEQGWWGAGTGEAGERGQRGAVGSGAELGKAGARGLRGSTGGWHRGAEPPGCWRRWSGLVGSGAGVLRVDEYKVGEQE